MTEVTKQLCERLFKLFLAELGTFIQEDPTSAKDFGNARMNEIRRLTEKTAE